MCYTCFSSGFFCCCVIPCYIWKHSIRAYYAKQNKLKVKTVKIEETSECCYHVCCKWLSSHGVCSTKHTSAAVAFASHVALHLIPQFASMLLSLTVNKLWKRAVHPNSWFCFTLVFKIGFELQSSHNYVIKELSII